MVPVHGRAREDGLGGPEVCAADSESAEFDDVLTRVRGWIDSGVGPGAIGVTARFNKNCDKAVDRLRAAGILAARLRGDVPSSPDAVQVGTMHAFKGLEFRCVAVIGVSEGALPYRRL